MTPHQRYYRKNRERLLKESRDRYHENIEIEHSRAKAYSQKNKEQIKTKRNALLRRKRAENPAFRLKENVSRAIRRALKENHSSKRGLSCLKFVGYTMQELKEHLESQFEVWMTWSNWGVYDAKTWDDSDQTTWTWQIDHIIPQSNLSYVNMEDSNFQKCWALDNLRPLSAKLNFFNGVDLLRKR